MHPKVHCYTIYNSQDMEATLMSFNREMDFFLKMQYIYTMEYYSAIKKEWNNFIFSNLDGSRDCHTEWSKSEKEKYLITSHMLSLKRNDTNELTKQKETHRHREQTYSLKGGNWGKDS